MTWGTLFFYGESDQHVKQATNVLLVSSFKKAGSLLHPIVHFHSGVIGGDWDYKNFENVFYRNCILVLMKKSEDRECRCGSLVIVQLAAENHSLAVENVGEFYKHVTPYR
jgi:hypothetical protein